MFAEGLENRGTQEQLKVRGEKQDQPSPKEKENLGEIIAKYHSDGHFKTESGTSLESL